MPVDDDGAPHLLLVPDGVDPVDVEALVRSRVPGATAPTEPPPDGTPALTLTLPDGTAVDGPWSPPELPRATGRRAAREGGRAEPASAYRLRAPRQRGGAVPAALRGRGGLLDAFADGEPVAAERAVLETGLALARRLDGSVLASTSAGPVRLLPEPRADLLLYSGSWLHPDALVHVLADALPGVALEGDAGPSPTPAAPPLPPPGLAEDERRWLHAEADAFDAAALAELEVTESYGVQAVDPDGTVWSVVVEAVATVPPALVELATADVVLYELRCHPAAGLPADAFARLDGAARALLAAVGGDVVDDDGFLVDLA